MLRPDSMSSWHESSCLVTSSCALSSAFLLSRNSLARSSADAPHLISSAYRL